MADVVVVNSDDPETEEAEIVEEIADSVEDAVMDATTISLVERVTRLEDALAVSIAAITERLDAIDSRLIDLGYTDEIQQEEIEMMGNEVEVMAGEAADAVEEVVEEVVEADDKDSPEGEDITPDEVPTVREHPWFRRWGRN